MCVCVCVCVSAALIIQYVTCVHRVIVTSVVCPALQYVFTLSHKRHDIWGGDIIDRKMCVLIFSATLT